jgi:Na+-driven multidrug efflux pump
MILGVIMTAFGVLIGKPVLDMMNTPKESYSMAWDYLLVCSIGVIFTCGYNMVSAVLRGMGDSRHPFIKVGAENTPTY